ncbi:MAG: hypothetical protein CPDRYMAC_0283 [uncultured Paraburkholderia sp.]|nr:MAG: hypothetical protein CPDRYDRY_6574 [uncultured Paraburkholderia sp.]CAH2910792.1 MAG: hypothetical protein CPDRYMAC_0283 [uncultured Paraburkholderia sp.]
MRPGALITSTGPAQEADVSVRLVERPDVRLQALLLERLKCHAADRGCPYDGCALEVAAIAGANGTVIGGITGSLSYDQLYIDLIHIDEYFRGHGFGERLLRHAEAWAQGKGASHVWLHTYSFQAPAFYLRCGYVKLATIGDAKDPHAMTFLTKRIG